MRSNQPPQFVSQRDGHRPWVIGVLLADRGRPDDRSFVFPLAEMLENETRQAFQFVLKFGYALNPSVVLARGGKVPSL